MANIKITDLTAYGNPATTDVLPIVDVGADVTKKVSVGEVVGKITGDVDVATDGTSSIAAGVIVNADVNAAAAIAGTKINPNFGSQTVVTTGDIKAGPGTAPDPSVSVGTTDNGLYAPGLDKVAISTSGFERVRVESNGNLLVGKTIDDQATQGFQISNFGRLSISRISGSALFANRKADDGTIVEFARNEVVEGTISVSGTTVSYNGAHLSRWSQLTGIDPYDKTARPEILRGTVMSNLDEMCDWTCAESSECQNNEQLNKTEISSVDDDPNVAGVFQSWDDDDNTWVNDYYLAMTGDFVIRIAADTNVQRGDLLCSAGDGTAKPQDDDIVRSKTIAKVTSTTVSCTYPDGSYCVPCVLMAC